MGQTGQPLDPLPTLYVLNKARQKAVRQPVHQTAQVSSSCTCSALAPLPAFQGQGASVVLPLERMLRSACAKESCPQQPVFATSPQVGQTLAGFQRQQATRFQTHWSGDAITNERRALEHLMRSSRAIATSDTGFTEHSHNVHLAWATACSSATGAAAAALPPCASSLRHAGRAGAPRSALLPAMCVAPPCRRDRARASVRLRHSRGAAAGGGPLPMAMLALGSGSPLEALGGSDFPAAMPSVRDAAQSPRRAAGCRDLGGGAQTRVLLPLLLLCSRFAAPPPPP